MRAYERMLRYVSIPTVSEDNKNSPTTKEQFILAKELAKELKELGAENVSVDERCYVYALIPATKGYEKKMKIGLIAHLDTAPDFEGKNIKPQIIKDYDGEDILLGNSGRTLSPQKFSHLGKLRGRTLITTDGTTLLGADDKAGIAEIMTTIEKIIKEDISHGRISIAFTPDEEVGAGADHFDVEKFGADFAYTIDGGQEGEIEYENFNACAAMFEVNGCNVHPGSAKGIMVNAQLVAMEINAMLPSGEIPGETENYEGFYHLTDMRGNVEKAQLCYLLRDHDADKFEERKIRLESINSIINEKYGKGTSTLTVKEQYKNMIEKIKEHFHIIESARSAIRKTGLEPQTKPIRGGTDGARLSFMGLPCPNLGTGGYAFHGPYEHITVEGMDKTVDILIELIRNYADRKDD